MSKAYLCLEDGTVLEGTSFGSEKEEVGELVFTTGMCGYLETLTDPSYAGQIVMHTFPLIGNYGVIPDDFEGECWLKGYVVKELCDQPSNFRSQGTLDAFLKEKDIPGIAGIDTRALTRKIRETGVMNACITHSVPASFDKIRTYQVKGVVDLVSTKHVYTVKAEDEKKHVVLVDYGAKRNIERELVKRGCTVTVVPASASAEEILSYDPDGIMLSNGPGDPSENIYQIEQIRKLMGIKPIFGICLGHQLTALANGAKTYKMKYGHRGVNQPVKDNQTGRTFITTQNHGYAVDASTLKNGVERFVNANDGTSEGIEYPDMKCFTVQFHPESCSGPKDTEFLFDIFMKNMEAEQYA